MRADPGPAGQRLVPLAQWPIWPGDTLPRPCQARVRIPVGIRRRRRTTPRSACSLPRISFKTPCLLGLMRMPCAQDPTRTPVRRGPCISAPPRDPPAEAATSLADAGPRDRAAPAKFNTTQTASISVASRVPYLQHATGLPDRRPRGAGIRAKRVRAVPPAARSLLYRSGEVFAAHPEY